MGTRIHSNGAKWAGQAPDSIGTLLGALRKYPLDRKFEMYGDFVIPRGTGEEGCEAVRFFGNFFTLSHVFQIDTDDPEIIDQLTRAIWENKNHADYLSQPDPWEEKSRKEKEYLECIERQCEEARKRARALLGIPEA